MNELKLERWLQGPGEFSSRETPVGVPTGEYTVADQARGFGVPEDELGQNPKGGTDQNSEPSKQSV